MVLSVNVLFNFVASAPVMVVMVRARARARVPRLSSTNGDVRVGEFPL